MLNKRDRSDYFSYTEENSLNFGDCQCDFCVYNILGVTSKCKKYPDIKPLEIINNEFLCDFMYSIEKIKERNSENYELRI